MINKFCDDNKNNKKINIIINDQKEKQSKKNIENLKDEKTKNTRNYDFRDLIENPEMFNCSISKIEEKEIDKNESLKELRNEKSPINLQNNFR